MQVTFEHFSRFGIRLAAYPVSQLTALSSASECPSADNENNWLHTWLQLPWTREALFLASPNLLNAWQATLTKSGSPNQAITNALWRYLFRAYGRSTPYGLFAAMGTGSIGAYRKADFGSCPWQAVSRPDIRILRAISQALSASALIRPYLRYGLNNSLYEVGGEYRFSKQETDIACTSISLSALTITPDLARLVEALLQGKTLLFEDLIALFEPEMRALVVPFLHQLIDAQFLISNLTFPVTGVEVLSYLLTQLGELPNKPPVYDLLKQIWQQLQTSPLPLSTLQQIQHQLIKAAHDLGQERDATEACIQTDLFFRPVELQLDETTLGQITQQVSKVAPVLYQEKTALLLSFKERFRNRWHDQEVALLTVLDPEYGIGLSADKLSQYPLITELAPPDALSSSSDTRLDEFREMLYSRFLVQGTSAVEILMVDVEKYGYHSTRSLLPPSWFLFGELFVDPDYDQPPTVAGPLTGQSLDRTGWRFNLLPAPGSSAAHLFGRFCHNDNSLRALVDQMNAWEQAQYPADLLVEFVHLPNKPPNAGNVVVRPILRSFELPYLTPSSLPPEQIIYLADLTVSVSEAGQILLRSKKTGQRVRPRHSSAHNTLLGDDIYQLLSVIQHQEYPDLGWSWGRLAHYPRLPRLIFQNLVIAPAQWTIQKEHLDKEVLTIDQVRRYYHLPRYVHVVEGDNKLLLDLDFAPAATLLLDEILKQDRVLLREWLGEAWQPWLANGADRYVSELIIPLKTRQGSPSLSNQLKEGSSTQVATLPTVPRLFFPGQDWLYLKVYLSSLATDPFLTNVLDPANTQLTKKGWSSQLFFVRYEDPDNHVRIRFRTTQKRVHQVLNLFNKTVLPFLESGLVYQVQIDTYQRELERYGAARIDDCEAIFDADSRMVLTWLRLNERQEMDRMQLALLSTDALLTDFGCTLRGKLTLCQSLQQMFFVEDGARKEQKRKLNDLYRTHQRTYFLPVAEHTALVEERSQRIRQSAASIRSTFNLPPDEHTYHQVISSIVHLCMNRIFQGQKRRYELIVHHFLTRHYESLLARSQKADS